jgi:hypothetical protein
MLHVCWLFYWFGSRWEEVGRVAFDRFGFFDWVLGR